MGASAASRIACITRRGLLFALLWVGLVGADGEGLVLGLAVVPTAVALSLRLLPVAPPLRLGRLLALLPGFHARSVLGGVDVAARAFAPRMPLAPGWVVAPVALRPGLRVALGAELSLMPGTLVAGSEGDRLLMHVLDRDTASEATLQREAARLEGLLAAGDTGQDAGPDPGSSRLQGGTAQGSSTSGGGA